MRSAKERHVYNHAFSRATLQPKIPDGKCTASIGLSTRRSLQWNATYEQTREQMLIVYPGLNSCAKVIDTTSKTNQPLRNKDHVIIQADNATDSITFRNLSDYSQWRTVSCGVQLTSTLGANTAQGSWMAIAVPIPKDESWFHWAEDRDDNILTYTQWEPSNQWFKCGGGCFCQAPLANWADNKYYRSGKIADLNKETFECIPHTQEHSFKRIEDNHLVMLRNGCTFGDRTKSPEDQSKADNTVLSPNGVGTVRLSASAANKAANEPSETMMTAIDTTWDGSFLVWMITLNINGGNANIRIDSANNQEFLCNCGSKMAKFMTESHTNKADHPAKTNSRPLEQITRPEKPHKRAKNLHDIEENEAWRIRDSANRAQGDIVHNPLEVAYHESPFDIDHDAEVIDEVLQVVEEDSERLYNWLKGGNRRRY